MAKKDWLKKQGVLGRGPLSSTLGILGYKLGFKKKEKKAEQKK